MKKIVIGLISIGLLVSATACSGRAITQENQEMNLHKVVLTQEEMELLALLGEGGNSTIYDYTLGEHIQSMRVSIYTLNEDLEWEISGDLISQVNYPKGRLAISSEENQEYRISVQDEGGRSAIVTALNEEDGAYSMHGMDWAETTTLKTNEEVPVLIRVSTNESSMSMYGVESYFEPKRLKGHGEVVAITIMFSEKKTDDLTRQARIKM
ncbi:MAG: hypothetical protein ACRCW2_00180 [Cellulosilyticaceae bacterium]